MFSYVSCYAIGVWYCTWAIAGNAQTTNVFEAKFGWDKDETIFYNTIISSAGLIGLAIGSFLGGPLIKNSRRKGAIISNIIAIVGAAISVIESVPAMSIGRLIVGIAAGAYNVVFGKMIVENMPEKLAGKFAMCHNASICVGFQIAFLMGAILPDPDNFQANKDDEMWRVIFLVPALIGVVGNILIIFIFRLEPISFCIMMGYEE